MKIALIGATGFVGSAILEELQSRNHELTAIARNPTNTANVKWEATDINDSALLVSILRGNDVVISAFNAGWTNPNLYEDFMKGSAAIEEAVEKSGVKRLIIIGGAGSLYVAPDLQAVDTPDFPKEIYPGANAARNYLEIIKKNTSLDWAYFSPAFEMHQGITTGKTRKYRLGKDNPVFNEDQRSILSVQDLAVVIADEVENPQHHQERFTAAY